MATRPDRCNVLNMEIRIAVDFPIFFGASLAVLSIGSLVLPGKIEKLEVATTKIISLFLPLLIVGLLAGLVGSPMTCAATHGK